MSASPDLSVGPAGVDLALVDAVEQASIEGWPASIVERQSDGWVLRATPGLTNGRTGNALPPRTRPVEAEELGRALERVRAFSAVHGIRGGLQLSPLELHAGHVPGLVAAGWEPRGRVWTMVADRAEVLERGGSVERGEAVERDETLGRGADARGARLDAGARRTGAGVRRADELDEWRGARGAEPDWLAAWDSCSPATGREIIDRHAVTVFANMAGRGTFGRLGKVATGIVTEDSLRQWAGLFALVVRADQRGQGLGRRLVLSLLESAQAPHVYLQVLMDNAPALGLYRSLGFRPSHSYQHLSAPEGWAAGRAGGF